MKEYFIAKFDVDKDYDIFVQDETKYVTPNVSYVERSGKVYFNPVPKHDYSKDYLTIVAKSSGRLRFSNESLMYQINNGVPTVWNTLPSGKGLEIEAGNKIILKKADTASITSTLGTFTCTADFDVEGNVMSLLHSDERFYKDNELTVRGIFKQLFSGCTTLQSAENLILPATALTDNCYEKMFYNCSSLTKVPSLPAEKLSNQCYYEMFYGCTSLTNAPELLAPTLLEYSYAYMFYNCSSLNYIKCLATDIRDTGCLVIWTYGVASSGTFVKDKSTTWPNGGSGIPNGWTVENV